jgi:hypothetical protein
VLNKFMRKESVHFDNCNYLLESADDILKSAKPIEPPPGTPEDDSPLWVKDPGEFLELYNIEKKAKLSGEICIDSDGKVSFSIGTEDAQIEINSKGGFALSVKSPSGITHKAEF